MPSLIIRHLRTYRYRRAIAFGEHRMMHHPRDFHHQRACASFRMHSAIMWGSRGFRVDQKSELREYRAPRVSVLVKRGLASRGAFSEEGVGEDDELSHDGDDGDLWGLAGRGKSLEDAPKIGIEAGTATSAGMKRAWRTSARPPRMKRLPRHCPLSRAMGARPARLAAHVFSIVPSSGMSVRR